MSICSRGVAALALALAGLGVLAAPAWASCIQQTQADQIARADVIAFGRVTSVDRGAGTLTFQALTVYKGDTGPDRITVSIGPGPRGNNVATSVDYRADPGDHLLYLQRAASGYATNDCSGSHPGPPSVDELRLLAPAGGTVLTYTPASDPLDRFVGPAIATLAAAAVAAFLVARRRKSGA